MKRSALLAFLLAALFNLRAQRPEPDRIITMNGPLDVQPILHAALELAWNGKTIYVDPYGGPKAFKGLASPDLILITDIHPDHLNTETLGNIDLSKATLVVPKAVADKLPDSLKTKAVVINNGQNTSQKGVDITAIAMYNLPEEPDSKHTKGRGNGYILRLGDKTIYISGDTEDIPEMRSLKNIDIAFVCMNLPYTMDVDQAASAVLEFKPKIVYPYHYRGKDGLSDVSKFKKSVNDGDKSIDVRLKNWYPEY